MAEIRSTSDLRTLVRSATDSPTTSNSNDSNNQVQTKKKTLQAQDAGDGLAYSESASNVGDATAILEANVRSAQIRVAATTTPPVTPASTTASTNDATQGVESFAAQVSTVRYEGTDSDSMTAAFMKLEGENLSTNQDIEGFLQLATHYLREAAFNIEKALRNSDPEAMLAQAEQLEQQAYDQIQSAAADNPQAQQALDKLNGNNGGADAWKALYDNASRELLASAEAYEAGDTAKAEEHEAKARTIMEAAGIDVSDEHAAAMGELALKMKAEGKTGNVITEYVGQNPDVVKTFLSPEEFEAVKDKGGEAIVAKVMEARGEALDGAESSITLGLALNASDQQTLEALMGGSVDPSVMGMLQGAYGLLAEAYEMRIRAYQTHQALLDAQNAIAEGKTAKGQFGIADRNSVGQKEILRGLFALTGGSRADQQARGEAAAEAVRAQEEVSKLLLQYIDNQSAAQRSEFRS